jgi:hypothetical protein
VGTGRRLRRAEVVVAGMDVSGVNEEQARAIYRAMLAASDDEGVELADFAN